MLSHTFAICAYQDSPYLEDCMKSLQRQSAADRIILCTSTPSSYIQKLADVYNIPVYVREGKNSIQEDWNYAYQKADTQLVTIVHQDDYYHRDYGKTLQSAWLKYPDTTVFMTDCGIVKQGRIQQRGGMLFVKHLLRLPLRFSSWANREGVKKLILRFGNPVICPSCTYNKEVLGEPLFDSPFQFALDWDTMWKLAGRPGRFVCVEKPLLYYRIHEGATTKACIQNHQRNREEAAMFGKMWPAPIVQILMFFYQKAYQEYD